MIGAFPCDNGRHACAERERSGDSPREPDHHAAPRNEETQSLVEGNLEQRGAQEARRACLLLLLRCCEGIWFLVLLLSRGPASDVGRMSLVVYRYTPPGTAFNRNIMELCISILNTNVIRFRYIMFFV